jgi:hypothetical protein
MKKVTAFLAFSLTSISAIACSSAMASQSVLFEYEIVKNGESVGSGSLPGQVGYPTELAHLHSTSYLGDPDDSQIAESLTKWVETGIKLKYTAKSVSEGKVLLSIDAEESDLIGIDKFNFNGVESWAPRVSSSHIQQQLVVKSGEREELSLLGTEKSAGSFLTLYVTATVIAPESPVSGATPTKL